MPALRVRERSGRRRDSEFFVLSSSVWPIMGPSCAFQEIQIHFGRCTPLAQFVWHRSRRRCSFEALGPAWSASAAERSRGTEERVPGQRVRSSAVHWLGRVAHGIAWPACTNPVRWLTRFPPWGKACELRRLRGRLRVHVWSEQRGIGLYDKHCDETASKSSAYHWEKKIANKRL
jgi:hypothetical protein